MGQIVRHYQPHLPPFISLYPIPLSRPPSAIPPPDRLLAVSLSDLGFILTSLLSDSKASNSSKTLAGIIGSSSSAPDLTQKQATKPVFGFAPPTASKSFASDGPKLASKPMFGFKPPASMSIPSSTLDLGQELASKPVFGFNPPTAGTSEGSEGPKLASKPLFGFQPPAAMEKKNGMYM